MSVKCSVTSRPVRGDSLLFKILTGSIFSSCSFKSTANSTGASVLRIGISPSLTASSPLKTAALKCRTVYIYVNPPCRSEEKRRKTGCPASHPPSNCPSSATLPA